MDLQQFKDVRGVARTESLFVETISHKSAKTYEPIYSLREYDHKGYPSIHKVYMESADEYEAAMKIVGSMAHWRRLCKLRWFMEGREDTGFEGLRQWRLDMAARDASTAKITLIEETEEGNVTAAKALFSLEKEGRKGKKGQQEIPTKTPSELDVEGAIGKVVKLRK